MKNLLIKILPLFFLLTINIHSQTVSEPDTNSIVQSTSLEFEMTKSPWGAVLRSAIVPGWGQFYNESYWKIPIIWGVLGSFVYGWIYYDDLYVDFRDRYNQSLIEEPGIGISTFKRSRDFYRDQRDLFTIYFALGYLLNLVDAFVDAHLFDFTVEENVITNNPQLQIRFKF